MSALTLLAGLKGKGQGLEGEGGGRERGKGGRRGKKGGGGREGEERGKWKRGKEGCPRRRQAGSIYDLVQKRLQRYTYL